MFPASLLEQAGVTLIAMDRPGFGLSTAGQGLGFTRYSGDAAALADLLGSGGSG
jgi:alpha-beta hydrolase superfamily lysophospholipase